MWRNIPGRAARLNSELNMHGGIIHVALDAAGGDRGMKVNIDGAIDAVSQSKKLHVILVGRENDIKTHLRKKQFDEQAIEIHGASGIVSMNEKPLDAARDDSNSITSGIELVRKGKADAFVSVGNTGAIAAAAYMRLGLINGIDRAPILAVAPTMSGKPVAILDVGANVDCKPHHLLQFSLLGTAYAKNIMGRQNPSVALLSIGEEEGKGNFVTREAYKLITQKAVPLGTNFIGNIEGGDILAGKADVVVCDGFLGNILLKFTESIFSLVIGLFKKGRRISILSVIGGLLMYPSIKRTLKDFNYAEYGGAPLLGVRGNVVIGHGISSAKAIANAILLAQQMAIVDLKGILMNSMNTLGELKDES